MGKVSWNIKCHLRECGSAVYDSSYERTQPLKTLSTLKIISNICMAEFAIKRNSVPLNK